MSLETDTNPTSPTKSRATAPLSVNRAYTRGLAISRLRLNADGLVIEAEGYFPNLRKWTYRYDLTRTPAMEWVQE